MVTLRTYLHIGFGLMVLKTPLYRYNVEDCGNWYKSTCSLQLQPCSRRNEKASAEKSRWRWRFLLANPLGRWLAADDGNVGAVDQDGPASATAKTMFGISERGMMMPEQASIVSGNVRVVVAPSLVDVEKGCAEEDMGRSP